MYKRVIVSQLLQLQVTSKTSFIFTSHSPEYSITIDLHSELYFAIPISATCCGDFISNFLSIMYSWFTNSLNYYQVYHLKYKKKI